MFDTEFLAHPYVLDLGRRILQVGILNMLYTLLALMAAAIAVDYSYMLYMRSKMPPGPFPWPIIGNTFMLPDRKPWIYFEEIARKYNAPLITIWIGR
jgi:hypothetical protein